MTRFETYVRDTVADLTRARRDELVAALDAEKAKIDAKLASLKEIVDEGLKALNAKVDAQARKFGWHVDERADPAVEASCFESNCRGRYKEAAKDYVRRGDMHEFGYCGQAVRAAAGAVEEFDALVEKTVTRLVVLKKDFNMKPDAFDQAMAEAVAKIVK